MTNKVKEKYTKTLLNFCWVNNWHQNLRQDSFSWNHQQSFNWIHLKLQALGSSNNRLNKIHLILIRNNNNLLVEQEWWQFSKLIIKKQISIKNQRIIKLFQCKIRILIKHKNPLFFQNIKNLKKANTLNPKDQHKKVNQPQ